jgi:hypothetical protein
MTLQRELRGRGVKCERKEREEQKLSRNKRTNETEDLVLGLF